MTSKLHPYNNNATNVKKDTSPEPTVMTTLKRDESKYADSN